MKKLILLLAVMALGLTPMLSGCGTMEYSPADLTDSDIQKDVVTRLRDDAVTARTTFGVSVDSGIVTLKGVVSGPNVKARAISVAEGTPGVSGVVDELTRF